MSGFFYHRSEYLFRQNNNGWGQLLLEGYQLNAPNHVSLEEITKNDSIVAFKESFENTQLSKVFLVAVVLIKTCIKKKSKTTWIVFKHN